MVLYTNILIINKRDVIVCLGSRKDRVINVRIQLNTLIYYFPNFLQK